MTKSALTGFMMEDTVNKETNTEECHVSVSFFSHMFIYGAIFCWLENVITSINRTGKN
jgi:hypothetical protein